MPLKMIREDITKIVCDAIVNAANPTLLGGGGVDGAIHAAAGSKLKAECSQLGGCNIGEAKITNGYNLPAKYVIHTVGPVWHGGFFNEKNNLALCYKNSLLLASERGLKTIAFPLISSGAYGFPKKEAFQIAVDTINNFLENNDMTVFLVLFDKDSVKISELLYKDITQYIDDNYVDCNLFERHYSNTNAFEASVSQPMSPSECKTSFEATSICELTNMLTEIDESFSEMLFRKIDEKGLTDSQCYKKANIDRKLFSKIRSNPNYKPSKTTAIALAIALELDIVEASELLKKAGFALSHSNKFDIIVEFFIVNKKYNVFEINEALFSFDQLLLN